MNKRGKFVRTKGKRINRHEKTPWPLAMPAVSSGGYIRDGNNVSHKEKLEYSSA